MSPRCAICSIVFLTAGCGTPAPVLELADKTSANVAIVGTRLRQLAAESERLYANRAENISRLHGVNATHRAALTYDIALTKKVGQRSELELIEAMEAWGKEVDEILASASGAEKQRRDELAVAQTKIDTRSQALQKVAETLSVLAKEESASERLRILRKFASEVRDDMKKQLDKGEGSAADAKKLLDRVRSEHDPKTVE